MSDILSEPSLPLSAVKALITGQQFRAAAIGLLFYDHVNECLNAVINLDRELEALLTPLQKVELVWKKNKHPIFFLYVFVGTISMHVHLEFPEVVLLQNRIFVLGYYIFDTEPSPPTFTHNAQYPSLSVALYHQRITEPIFQLCVLSDARCHCSNGVDFDGTSYLTITSTTSPLLNVAGMSILIGLTMNHLFRIQHNCAGTFGKSNCTGQLGLFHSARLLSTPLIFAQLLVSALVWAKAPSWMNVVNPWSAALPSLLGSRLILSMREAVERQNNETSYVVEDFTSPHVVFVEHSGRNVNSTLRTP
ncbi:hypothetical protein BC835DRAFT_1302532 [Cytidiella melzeri]|nr:hypothetical protein BC835DRAFT_1302532 [Cytidiella melzeri]